MPLVITVSPQSPSLPPPPPPPLPVPGLRVWVSCWQYVGVVMMMVVGVSGGVGVGQRAATLECVLYSAVQQGGYVSQTYTVSGAFSPCGTPVGAEGRIIQVSGDDDEYDDGRHGRVVKATDF
ncbi:hypothetical protein ACOMHN_051778 [Nucella lapillus]